MFHRFRSRLSLYLSPQVSLRSLLIIPFVLQIVGVVGVVGYLAYQDGQKAVNDLADRLMTEVSGRISDRLNHYARTPQIVVNANYTHFKTGNLNINDLEQIRKELWKQFILFPEINGVSFSSERGEYIGYGRILSEELRQKIIQNTQKDIKIGATYSLEIQKSQPDLRRYYLIDEAGKRQTLIRQFKAGFQDLYWYRYIKNAQKSGWTTIYKTKDTNSLALSAFTKIHDAAGNFQGAFITGFLLEDISTYINQLKFSPSGQTFIIERSGNLVATSTKEVLHFNQQQGEVQVLQAVQSTDRITQGISQQLLQELGSFRNLKTSQKLQLTLSNQLHYVQVVPYQDQYGLDWLIVVVVPESDFMAQIQTNTRKTIVLCLGALGIAIALGTLTTNRITQIIKRLNRATSAIASGELDYQIPSNLKVIELNQLSVSFNQMAQQLRDSFDQVQTALQESQERYSVIFRNCPDPITISSLEDGRLIEVNDSFLKISGFTREEVLGKTVYDLNLVINYQQLIPITKQIQQARKAENYEFAWRDKSGTEIISLSSSEIIELQGKQYIITVSKEISNLKQVENELRKTLQELTHHINNSPLAILEWNHEFKIQRWSPQAEKMFGWTAEEVLGSSVDLWNLIYEGDRKKVNQVTENLLNGVERHNSCANRNLTKDGEVFEGEWYNSVLLDDSGQLISVLSLGLDITERKKAEVELRESKQLIETITESSSAILYIFDLIEQRNIYINHQVQEILGYSPEEIQAMGNTLFSKLAHPEDFPIILEYWSQFEFLSEGDWREIEYRMQDKNGKWHWLYSRDRILEFAPDGQPQQISGTAIDLTERKQLEIDLQATSDQLNDILNNAVAAISSFQVYPDGSWDIAYLAAGCETISGYTPAELMANKDLWDSRILSEDLETLNSVLFDDIFSGFSNSYEYRFRHKDGRLRWISQTNSSRWDAQKKCWIVTAVSLDISERKQVEIALQKSESRFQYLVTAIPGVIYTVVENFQGPVHFEYLSPVVEDVHEVSLEQILQNASIIFEQIHPDDLEDYRKAVVLSIENMQLFKHEWRIITPSGKIKWLQASSRPEKRQNGDIAWYGLVLDATERKQIEAARKASETMNQAIRDAIPDLLICMDADGNYLDVKPPVNFPLLQPIELLIGSNIRYILPENLAQQRLKAVRKTLETRETQIYEFPLEIEQNKRWQEVRIVPLGQNTVLILIRDMTERQRTEEKLRRSEAALMDAQRIAHLGSWEYDVITQKITWSEELFRIHGIDLTQPEPSYIEYLKLIHPEYRRCLQEAINQAIQVGIPYEVEFQYIRPDGFTGWILGRAEIARNSQGKVIKLLGTALDISDRKQAEYELRQAKEAAEAANKAKSAFLASMSHELRTPLHAILGFTQLMSQSTHLAPEYLENLEIINRSGEHLLTLINDILDLAKIESGRTHLIHNEFDFYRFMDELKSMLSLRIQEKQLEFNIVRSPTVPCFIKTDEIKLRQILINLIGNAIKFTTQGHIIVRIHWDEQPAEMDTKSIKKGRLYFEIEDTGVGIQPQELDHLFEPFVQLEAGKNTCEGTGLGLAISSKFIKLLGGAITVDSKINQGTTFKFYIQAKRPEQIEYSLPSSTRQSIIGLEPNQPQYRILITDNSKDNCQLLTKMLSPLGFEVQSASHGFKALEVLQNWQPDLIFMDLQMPQLDGFKTLEKIRDYQKKQGQPLNPIIAITASKLEVDQDTILAVGFDDLIAKPFTLEQILITLQKFLGVRYLYRQQIDPKSAFPASSSPGLQPLDLTSLSVELITRLEQATIRGNLQQIYTIIAEIQTFNEPIAIALKTLVDQFDYVPILQSVDEYQQRQGLDHP